jgi:group I intron endonuclease
MAAFVYLATNKLNGKRYVGATSRTVAQRMQEHLRQAAKGLIGCRRFYAAIRKHGAEAFEWITLVECANLGEALEQERKLIAEIKSEYNITPGGQGRGGNRQPRGPQRPEVVKKRADSNRGKVPTQEHREKIRASLKGRKRPPEVVAKILASRAVRYAVKPWVEQGVCRRTWKKRQQIAGVSHV